MLAFRRVLLVLPLLLASLTVHSQAAEPTFRQVEIQGWTLHLDTRLERDSPDETARALKLLEEQLCFIIDVVPERHIPQLQQVTLWFSPLYPGIGPKAVYHPSVDWLKKNDRNPEMARCVEFTNIAIFEKEVKRMPVFVLHELAHAYHDQVLGFDHVDIKAAYDAAKSTGLYDQVRRGNGKIERAYAITNAKEYFAENTEAYFGQNDFFPFNATELKAHDPRMYALLEKIWGQPQ
ncbi:metallopeptidase [Rubinisphaera margarita]|uniref:metallopeptidase n=1 Tax=Rubinisphaera margarita TaxID=2909586 RepID=UPI001EE8D660|nr:metallopeptidase [Rubinisphaera margarita]MCG6158557.1 metallopeptidase [Rubinisphaera margarita]